MKTTIQKTTIQKVVLRAVAVFLPVLAIAAAHTALAADWTDANSVTYTALKSINGKASGYINTGIVPAGTECVKFKYKPASVSGSHCIYCSRWKSNYKYYRLFTGLITSSKFRIDRYNTQVTCNNLGTLNTSTDYSLSADYRSGTIRINGTDESVQLGSGDYTPVHPLVLFAAYDGGGTEAAPTVVGVSAMANGELYYLQLWNKDAVTLEHNFMPAVQDSDSTPGLYDTVTGTFYPATDGTFTPTAYTASERTGKKWTGAAGDGLMSTAANWENNDKPVAGDDVDFTIAAPNAAIVADIDATFGKIYLGVADLPAFSGALSATAINDLERMTAYDTATDGFTFTLAAPSGQDFTWNGGAAANWNTADTAWTYNNAASVWYNNNNAIFSTANATVTLTESIAADSLAFTQPATIAGSAVLTVPAVSVAPNVSANISAPTAGALTKTGAGTLTLGSSRAAVTTLSEGTLTMSGSGTTLDWSTLTLGTDPAKPVTLRFEDGAGLASPSSECIFGNVPNVTSVVCKAGGDWTHSGVNRIGRAAGANTTFVNESGDLTFTDYISVGAQASSDASASTDMAVAAGTVSVSHSADSRAPYIMLGSYGAGTLTVTNSGVFNVTASMALSIHSGSGTLNVSDGGTATIGTELVFGWDYSDAGAATVNLGTGGTLASRTVRCANYGTGTVNFDGGTLKAGAAATLIQSSDRMTVNVGANGGTIDNNAFSVTLPCTITGAGGMTFVGSGTTTVSVNQSYLGTTTVADGTTLSVTNGVSFAGPVAFAAGSKLNIAGYKNAAALVAASVTLPAEGTVSLTLNGGAFAEGVYAICSASGLTREDGSKFSFEMEDGVAGSKWSVVNDMLVLTVGNVGPNAWTGLGGDGRMSNGANWCGGEVPAAGADIDLSSISSDTTIIANAGRTFGTVTVGSGVITFTNELSATAFAAADDGPNPTAKISVAADSTVTLDGDLEFAANETVYVCHSVAAGGVFAVTGDIIATPQQTTHVAACVTTSIDGTISARGLVSNGSLDESFGLARGQQGSHVQWLIGDHGISGTTRLAVGNRPNVAATITAAADFTVSAEIIQYRSLTFNTGGHTISLGAGTSEKSGGISGNVNEDQGVTGVTTIAGSGKVIVNYNVNDLTSDANPKANPFTVASGATLAFNPGADIGTGALTAKSGGTLEISSGTTTFDSLTVEDGAILGFNFTERKVAPALSVTTSATLPSSVAVKVSAADGIRPKGGSYQLTSSNGAFTGATVSLSAGAPSWVAGVSVADGEIVLEVKSVGFQIIVE